MNKKKSTIILLLSISIIGILIFFSNSFSQNSFTYEITGQFPGSKKILLSGDSDGSILLDSTSNADGKFIFKGTQTIPRLGMLIVEREGKEFSDYYPIFIEHGKLKVELYNSGYQIKVSGSKNNEIMYAVESENQEFYAHVPLLYDSLNNASKRLFEINKEEVINPDSVQYYQKICDKFTNLAAPYVNKRDKNLKKALSKYPNTFFTAYYGLEFMELPADTLRTVYATFDKIIRESEIGREWYRTLFEQDHLIAGELAPKFRVSDINDKEIALEDYKGKYVLLDFWATWCGPCRAGNPHLIDLYKKYKNLGIEFIGIADDDKNLSGWKKAVKDDGIGIWPQVLRGAGTKSKKEINNDLTLKYKVNEYPTKILIDKEGKIVGQFSDEELTEVFEKIFSTK